MSRELLEKLWETKKVISTNSKIDIVGVGALITTESISGIMEDLAREFIRTNIANSNTHWMKEYVFVSYLVKSNNRVAYILRPKNMESDTIKVDYKHKDIKINDVDFDMFVSTIYLDTFEGFKDSNKEDISMYEIFTGNKHIEINYIVEGMVSGYNSVQSEMRRAWMEEHCEPIISWVENSKYYKKLDIEDTHMILKAMIYFCEMNQDINNNLILSGFKNFMAHYTTANSISEINTDMSIDAYIPELKTMHPYTQAIVRHIMGELFINLTDALIKEDK